MDTVELNGEVSPCIEVVEACGEWFVRVVEVDQEITRRQRTNSYPIP